MIYSMDHHTDRNNNLNIHFKKTSHTVKSLATNFLGKFLYICENLFFYMYIKIHNTFQLQYYCMPYKMS